MLRQTLKNNKTVKECTVKFQRSPEKVKINHIIVFHL